MKNKQKMNNLQKKNNQPQASRGSSSSGNGPGKMAVSDFTSSFPGKKFEVVEKDGVCRVKVVEPLMSLSSPSGGIPAGSNVIYYCSGNNFTEIQLGFDGDGRTLTELNTRLSRYAALYQKYRVVSADIVYEPTCPVTTSGSLAIAVDLDSAATYATSVGSTSNPPSVQAVLEYERSRLTTVYSPAKVNIARRGERVEELKYVLAPNSSGLIQPQTTADRRQTSVGDLIVYAGGGIPASTALGFLYLVAEYEFHHAVLRQASNESVNVEATGLYLSADKAVNAASPLFAAAWSQIPQSVGYPSWWSSLYQTVNAPGRYIIDYDTAISSAASNPSPGTNELVVNQTDSYAATGGSNPTKTGFSMFAGYVNQYFSQLFQTDGTSANKYQNVSASGYIDITQTMIDYLNGFPIPGYWVPNGITTTLKQYLTTLILERVAALTGAQEAQANAVFQKELDEQPRLFSALRMLNAYRQKFPGFSEALGPLHEMMMAEGSAAFDVWDRLQRDIDTGEPLAPFLIFGGSLPEPLGGGAPVVQLRRSRFRMMIESSEKSSVQDSQPARSADQTKTGVNSVQSDAASRGWFSRS